MRACVRVFVMSEEGNALSMPPWRGRRPSAQPSSPLCLGTRPHARCARWRAATPRYLRQWRWEEREKRSHRVCSQLPSFWKNTKKLFPQGEEKSTIKTGKPEGIFYEIFVRLFVHLVWWGVQSERAMTHPQAQPASEETAPPRPQLACARTHEQKGKRKGDGRRRGVGIG